MKAAFPRIVKVYFGWLFEMGCPDTHQ